MEPGLMYRALKDKAVHLIDGFSTDGRIPAYNLITLEDDKGFFPPYYAAPIIRRDTLERHPELEHILNALAGRITGEAMQLLNYRVDKKGERATDVAFDFLVAEGLINTDTPAEPPAGNGIAVGGKHFTEQEILGEIIALLIEHTSAIPVTRYLNLGGTIICFNALHAGDIDIYTEYTGTGLINILGREMLSDPEKVYDVVREEFSRDFDLIWLKPFGFNNTYALTMRKDVAHSLGIQSISDLAEYLAR
jgi:osmoprotectant transport system permease protein